MSASTGKQYIVILNQECESILPPIVDEHHRKLLIAALMHIYMSRAPVREGWCLLLSRDFQSR